MLASKSKKNFPIVLKDGLHVLMMHIYKLEF